MPSLVTAAALALGVCAAGAAWAAPAAPPAGSVEPERIMGRWYEILRMPNKLQRNCYAAYQEWSRKGDAYSVQQVCHRDGPNGKIAAVGGTAKPLNAQNTEFECSFFGGLMRARYVVTDHAPDYSWLIATTADGRYPKLLARSPDMPEAEQVEIKQRMARLGFDVTRLEAVVQSAG